MSSLKEVVALAGQTFEVDTSTKACSKFGFRPDQRIVVANGKRGSVVGVAPLSEESSCVEKGKDVLWVALDGHNGKVSFCPNPAKDLKPEVVQ